MFRPGLFPEKIPLWARKLIFAHLSSVIQAKFLLDSRSLPLQPHDWPLYLDIHVVSALRLRRLPNLLKPVGFNDQIKWLMLFGQHELMPSCADKYEVRHYIAETIGREYLIPLKSAGDQWADIAASVATGEGVLKCSHDSGSAYLFKDVATQELVALEERFRKLLLREHGVGKGEWYYGHFPPRLIVEERLWSLDKKASPTDIKVHCVGGEPRLVHLIDGRQTGVERQGFFNPDGNPTSVRVKPHRGSLPTSFPTPPFEEIMPLARTLAGPFRYVRVDFYYVEGRIYFGELTFHEQAGLFQSRDEELSLGRALDIPCLEPSPTLNTAIPRDQQLYGTAVGKTRQDMAE